MNPAQLLTASGISPAEVAKILPEVDLQRIAVRAAPPWLARLWGREISAMTLRRTIYVRSVVLEQDPGTLGPMIVHELVHVRQWSELGVIRFLWSYVVGYLRGRLAGLSHSVAYRAIPLEAEAREVAGQLRGPIGPV